MNASEFLNIKNFKMRHMKCEVIRYKSEFAYIIILTQKLKASEVTHTFKFCSYTKIIAKNKSQWIQLGGHYASR